MMPKSFIYTELPKQTMSILRKAIFYMYIEDRNTWQVNIGHVKFTCSKYLKMVLHVSENTFCQEICFVISMHCQNINCHAACHKVRYSEC